MGVQYLYIGSIAYPILGVQYADEKVKEMIEYLGQALSADRIRRSSETQCPKEWCRHEFRNVDICDRCT